MKYKVNISSSAKADLKNLALFLLQMMSIDGANKYLYAMQLEIMSLSVLADLYHPSNYMDVRTYNPKARFFRICNPKDMNIRIYNPHYKC